MKPLNFLNKLFQSILIVPHKNQQKQLLILILKLKKWYDDRNVVLKQSIHINNVYSLRKRVEMDLESSKLKGKHNYLCYGHYQHKNNSIHLQVYSTFRMN